MGSKLTSISLLTLVGRNFRLNCILKQELRRYGPRSQSTKKSPFRPLSRAFCPHPAHKSSLRVGRGSCGMPSLRRCPLANWPRISVGNWAPPLKERKGSGRGAEGVTHFLAQRKRGWPFSTFRLRHASRSTLHARPAGSGPAQTLPRWLLPDTDSRIGKDRAGPDLHERPLYIQYVTEPGDSCGKFETPR